MKKLCCSFYFKKEIDFSDKEHDFWEQETILRLECEDDFERRRGSSLKKKFLQRNFKAGRFATSFLIINPTPFSFPVWLLSSTIFCFWTRFTQPEFWKSTSSCRCRWSSTSHSKQHCLRRRQSLLRTSESCFSGEWLWVRCQLECRLWQRRVDFEDAFWQFFRCRWVAFGRLER